MISRDSAAAALPTMACIISRASDGPIDIVYGAKEHRREDGPPPPPQTNIDWTQTTNSGSRSTGCKHRIVTAAAFRTLSACRLIN